MITANLTKVRSEEDLNTREVTYELVFQLPTGKSFSVPATEEEIRELSNYTAPLTEEVLSYPTTAPMPAPIVEYENDDDESPDQDVVESEPEVPLIDWRIMHTDILPKEIKELMSVAGENGEPLPPLPMHQIIQIRDEMLAEYFPQESVQLSDGPPISPIHGVPQRRVDSNAAGFPIVPRTALGPAYESDPGEVAETDEDGEQF